MKTLVTGGAGLIGSHLVKRLLKDGREVLIADDFSRGKQSNLLDLGIQIDCTTVNLTDFSQALKATEGAETVFHLAAMVGSLELLHGSKMSELDAFQQLSLIDINVFKACLKNNVKRIIYTSSVSAYPIELQQTSHVVLPEGEISHYNPEGGYGWAKLLGEIQLDWIRDIDVGIARVFNVYGENESPDKNAHVVPALIRKAISYPDEDFIVWGDGTQSRDFLYVTDAVDALIRLEKKASNPPTTINIGSDQAVPISTIAEKIVEISGKDMAIKYDPSKPIGPLSRTADTSRTRDILGWQPQVDLDEGLRRTYLWAENRLKV